MAAFFYDSTGSNTAPYDTWAKSATSLATVAAAMAAGDTLWVGDDSNEVVAGSTITATFPGTSANPNFIYCVDHTKASPGTGDLKTGAAGAGSVTTTGATSTLTLAGSFYCYGVFFSCASGANTINFAIAQTSGNAQKYENCVLKNGGTSGGNIQIGAGTAAGYVWLVNCTITLSAAGASIQPRSRCTIQGGSLTGTAPTTLIASTATGAHTFIEGFDFNTLGNHTLIGNITGVNSTFVLKDCKVPAAYTRTAALTIAGGTEVSIIRADNGATNYIEEKYNYWGSQLIETTILRTGGATDGTTPITWKVTPLNSSWVEPFVCFPITIWNTTVGSVAVTLHATSNIAAGAFPNTDDIWIEVEGLGTSGNPQGIYANNTKANNLATGSAYSTDSATWAGSPAGGTFAMTATITTTQAGPLTIYVKCAKTSTIFYVDPLPSISGVTVSKSFMLAPGVYHNELKSGGGMLVHPGMTGGMRG